MYAVLIGDEIVAYFTLERDARSFVASLPWWCGHAVVRSAVLS